MRVCCLAVVITPTLWMLIGVVSRVTGFPLECAGAGLPGQWRRLGATPLAGKCVGRRVIRRVARWRVDRFIYSPNSPPGKTRSILRGAYEVLVRHPSIVPGYASAIWVLVVLRLGFSLAAGVLVLSA